MSFWIHLAAETREGARVTWYWGTRAAMLVVAVHLIGGVAAAFARSGSLEERAMAFVAVGTYGLAQGLLAGVAVGAVALARRLAGWGLVAPGILVPVGIAITFYLGGEHFGLPEAVAKLTAEVRKHCPEATTTSALIQFPLMYFFAAPLIVITLLVTPATFFQAMILYYLCFVLIVCGAVGGTLISAPILLAATWTRLRRRAKERNVAGGKKAFGSHYMGLEDAEPIAG